MTKNNGQVILIISILALTVATLWIYLGVHQALTKTERPVLTTQETQALNPQWDESVFQELQKRKP